MALSVTLYRFTLEVSNIDQNHYETLEFRVAQHPSETMIYLLSRVIAYAHNAQEGLEFSQSGLADPDAPALQKLSPQGVSELWIEIGQPSAKKLHKATKKSKVVKVYNYKDPQVLLKELVAQEVHKLETIHIYSLPQRTLEKIAKHVERDNKWSMIFMDGVLTINIGSVSEQIELVRYTQLSV